MLYVALKLYYLMLGRGGKDDEPPRSPSLTCTSFPCAFLTPSLSLSPFVRVHCFNLSVWHSHQLQYLRSHKNAVVTRFTPVWTSAYTLWSTCHDATKLQHWPTFLRQAKVEICQGRDWSLRFRTRGGRIDLVGGGKIARMPSRKINGLHSSPTSGCITGLLR